ncbi:Major Facilitator Superfamily protein [Thermoanaerobacter uzonensis DSM 18761]|uniref:Major Facilitator Superfamily protein n=1 Tax=Thermoanaerobacter uzonensis DSM 18761 TaxID=1123369 RepID=A0A1M4XEI7_9THEO|nr:MFS transporter [Thermoanaerobacter uzonensis]SHE91841.1 Major Facilitator Superfamily protein [Thermoanaerobacter uzonensis DSM 18761]
MLFIDQIKFLPKEVKRFIATEALLGIGMGIFGLVLNLHLLALNVSPEQIGALNSVGTLVMGAAAIPAGFFANYIGRKRIFISGITLTGIGYWLFGLGKSIGVFYLAQIIQFIGISFLITTEVQLLFSYAKTNELETVSYSLLFAIFTLFSGIGTLLGGFIPNWFPYGNTKYQSSVYISATLILVAALLRGILLPCVNNSFDKGKSKLLLLNIRIYQVFDKKILLITFYLFLAGMAFSTIVPFQNVIVKFRMGWSDEYVSYLLTVNGLILFFASMIMPWIINKFGTIKAYYYVYGMNLLFAFILAFNNISVMMFSTIFLLRSGSFTLLNNMMESQTMSVVEEEKRDFFAGVKSLLRSIGSAIASYLAGYILENKNYTYPFLITFIILLVSLLYFVVFIKPIFLEKIKNGKFSFEEEIQKDVEGM